MHEVAASGVASEMLPVGSNRSFFPQTTSFGALFVVADLALFSNASTTRSFDAQSSWLTFTM
jgi:hypothetical protein